MSTRIPGDGNDPSELNSNWPVPDDGEASGSTSASVIGAASLLDQLQETASLDLAQARSLPPGLYRHPDVANLESDRIWSHDWVCPGLAADIPNPGDYLSYSIAGEPIFCVRDKAGVVRTFSNVCRHRMMQLVEGSGNKSRITCPYHAWGYNLDGKLVSAGFMNENDSFRKGSVCLPEFRTEVWNGWIYVTLNPNAESVESTLAPLHDIVGRYHMEQYVPVVVQDHVWDTNWKLLTENFMEGYHLPVAHRDTVGAWFNIDDTQFPDQKHKAFTFQTFTKDETATYGRAHADNTALQGSWRATSVLPTIFPAHMYVLAPDHLWYLSLRPRGVGQVEVRFGVAVAPEVWSSLDNPEAWLGELVSFFDVVNAEDRYVVEGIYSGSGSHFAEPGPLSWLEREIHDFQQYLARRLCRIDH